MKAKITNTSRALQGVWTDEGLEFIEPGATRTLTIAADHVDRTKRSKLLKVDGASNAASGDNDPDALPRNVPKLRGIAKAEEIDLGDAAKADDIIAKIEEGRKAKAAPAE